MKSVPGWSPSTESPAEAAPPLTRLTAAVGCGVDRSAGYRPPVHSGSGIADTQQLRKARGAFFTPPELCRYMAEWAIRAPTDRVLEPSCGEAAFLLAVSAAPVRETVSSPLGPDLPQPLLLSLPSHRACWWSVERGYWSSRAHSEPTRGALRPTALHATYDSSIDRLAVEGCSASVPTSRYAKPNHER